MARKKQQQTTPSATPATGLKTPMSNKVNKRDSTPEKPNSNPKLTSTADSSPPPPPPPPSNAPSQRRKGSLASLLNEETMSKRRVSFKPNPNSPILIESDHEKPSPRSISPELATQAEVKKEQGNAQFKQGKFTQAIVFYSEAIELNADNPAYRSNRAAASMALRDYQSALNDMEIVNSQKFIDLGFQPCIKNLTRFIRCLMPLGKFYQARQALNKLLEHHLDSIQVQKEDTRLKKLELLLDTIKQDRTDKKWYMLLLDLSEFEKQLDCGPLKVKDWLIWRLEGLCGQKKWEEAKILCNELVQSYSSDPEVLYCRAKVKYSQGSLAETIAHCQEAMRCDPDFANARNLLRQAKNIESLKASGNASFSASNYEAAIKMYSEASLIDPTNEAIVATLDSNRAIALLKLERNKEAIEACDKILRTDDQHFKALRTRARAKKSANDLNAALADFDSASKLAPSSSEKSELLSEIKALKLQISRAKYVDHYKVLDVPRQASDNEIKKAFYKKSLIHHPDKGGNEEKFKELNESYTILQDPALRRKFDMVDPDNPDGGPGCRQQRNGCSSSSDSEFSYSWDDLFGSAGPSMYSASHFSRPRPQYHNYQSSSAYFPTSM